MIMMRTVPRAAGGGDPTVVCGPDGPVPGACPRATVAASAGRHHLHAHRRQVCGALPSNGECTPRWPSGKTSAATAADLRFDSHLLRDFSGSSHTRDLKVGAPVATLSGAWRQSQCWDWLGRVSVYCDWVRWKV